MSFPSRPVIASATVALSVLLVGWLSSCATPRSGLGDPPREMKGFLYSPYLYVNLPPQLAAPTFMSTMLERVKSLIGLPGGDFPAGVKALTLAFATGECGQEHWDGVGAEDMVNATLVKLRRSNIDYVISTGGADGIFTCSSAQGMEKFIARYNSRHLLGFDFDIEAGQSEAVIANLVKQIHGATQRHPHLRMSFTLATVSATEPGQPTLNAHGAMVMKAIGQANLKNYFVNLMVMNFGEARPENCVVQGNRCAMAASSITAAQNFSKEYRVPLQRIELTPMIGVNDWVDNIFTLGDARQLADYVHTNNLGGLHFWSLNRDGVCLAGSKMVSPSCHGLPGLATLAFTNAFAAPVR
jgi:chitinase